MVLKVFVIGAGLGGLGAAIALSQAGHDVEIFEQSSFLNEVGAAIHVPPNACRVLKSWGIDLNDLDGVYCNHLTANDQHGNYIYTPATTKELLRALDMDDEWLLTHRVDFHNALRKRVGLSGNGYGPEIHLATRIISVDAGLGEIVFQDGTKRRADLIIGADGVHSRSVAAVLGELPQRKSSGQSCFRFLVPMEKVYANPVLADFFKKHSLDGQQVFASNDRRLIIYPCRSGKLLNIAGIFPTSKDDASVADSQYQAGGRLEDLLETYDGFCPELVELCKMAEDLKLWTLATRNPPRTFWNGKLVLVGDAAHPTLPHQGQGGAQAIEDGATLGGLFPSDTLPAQIPSRLRLYNKIRYGHSVTVMFMSRTNNEGRGRMMDELRGFVPDAYLPDDMFEYTWNSYSLQDAQFELNRSLLDNRKKQAAIDLMSSLRMEKAYLA